MGERGVSDSRFMRWMRGRDEEHTIETEAYGGRARESEMAIVDGVEGAAEDRQFQGYTG